MAVELADLVPSLSAALNVPGSARPMFDFSDETPWIDALANGFWNVKSRGRATGLYEDFRINTDGDQIVNIVDDTVDMDREDQQLIVLQTGLTAIETLLLSLPTRTHDKAGPVETERERSSTVLRQLLLDKRAELEEALKELGAGTASSTRVQVIDAVLARFGGTGVPTYPTFIN